MTKTVHVMVGVIYNAHGQILIARRQVGQHLEGLWEFPGGKLESHETPEIGLQRELHEELGIVVGACSPLIQIQHQYPEKTVYLDVYSVTSFEGMATGVEGQVVQWVDPSDLRRFDFPAANQAILKAIALPERMAITGHFRDLADFEYRLEALANQGLRCIQFRAPWLEPQSYSEMCQWMVTRPVFQRFDAVYANCAPAFFDASGLRFLHLTERELQGNSSLNLMQSLREKGQLLGLSASCHNFQACQVAEALDADFVYFSPIKPTKTHPEAAGVGWDALSEFTALAKTPVYALGGLSLNDIEASKRHGAQGIAAISAFWD